MATKKDMRRNDLIVPYVPPEDSKDNQDFQSTMTSTLPMAAIFTRNKYAAQTCPHANPDAGMDRSSVCSPAVALRIASTEGSGLITGISFSWHGCFVLGRRLHAALSATCSWQGSCCHRHWRTRGCRLIVMKHFLASMSPCDRPDYRFTMRGTRIAGIQVLRPCHVVKAIPCAIGASWITASRQSAYYRESLVSPAEDTSRATYSRTSGPQRH